VLSDAAQTQGDDFSHPDCGLVGDPILMDRSLELLMIF
jgi:hypothetical protein